jgi:DNA repair exonuclease SbcCD ATPase subunit
MWTGQRYEPCPSSNRSIATHKVDDSVWDWIVWLLSDDDNLEAGLQYMADNRDSEIENTRRELALVEKLLSENEQLLKRLVTEMVNHDDVVLEVFRQQIEEAKNSRKKLEAEKSQLIERISQVEISQELRTQIKESAAIIRERLSEIKYKDKRYIMDILNARVVFNVDDEKRWLDVKCDLPASDASIVLCNSVKTRLPIKQI